MLIKFCLRTNYASRQGYPQWMWQQKMGQGEISPWQALGSSLWMSSQNCMLCIYSCGRKEESSSIHGSTCLEFPVPMVVFFFKYVTLLACVPFSFHPSLQWDKEGQVSWLFTLESLLAVVFSIRALERKHYSSHLTDPFQPHQFCYSVRLWTRPDIIIACAQVRKHTPGDVREIKHLGVSHSLLQISDQSLSARDHGSSKETEQK